MAGSIRTPPATAEYRENFDRATRRRDTAAEAPGPSHECERCGKVLKAASECACSALRVGGAEAARPCERCGRQTASASARLCDYCEFHRGGRRR